MKIPLFPHLLALLAASPWAAVAATPAQVIRQSGPHTNRIDVVYAADGFTASQMHQFLTAVDRATRYRDTATVGEPYRRYKNFFNFYRIELVSVDSGITHPGQAQKNTPLLGLADGDRLGTVNSARLRDSVVAGLAALGVENDGWNHAVLNDAGYYNSGGTATCVFSKNYWGEIALHEGGHAFHRLADEYGGTQTAPANEPPELNTSKDSTGNRWKQWLGYNQPGIGLIGAYEGARYCRNGMYRPDNNSKMNLTSQLQPRRFNIVSLEKIILDIYAKVRPLDGFLDTAGVKAAPDSLWVKTVDPAVLKVDWYIDSVLHRTDGGERLRVPDDLKPGTHVIRAKVYDEVVVRTGSSNASPHALDWVRRDLDKLQQTVAWRISVPGAIDTTPSATAWRAPSQTVNPRAGRVTFELPWDGGYRARLYTHDGRLLASLKGAGLRGTQELPLDKALQRHKTLLLKLDPLAE